MSEAIELVDKPRIASGGGRPARYKLKDGTVVPGVTTIASKYKDPGPLMHWAHKMGIEGKDFRAVRDEAGEAGHLTHAWIEADLHGVEREPVKASPETLERAEHGFAAYSEWRKQVNLTVIITEYPLISELYKFGGTLDAIAMVNGAPMLLDWKSGSGVYPEVIAQLAAYRQLIRENVGHRRYDAPNAACCLRVGKEFSDFHYHMYPSEVLDLGFERFRASQWMYEVDKSLSKVCS